MNFLVLVLLLLIPFTARANIELEQAEASYQSLEYENCRQAAQAALALPANRLERMNAYRLAGLCHAALGDLEAARESFLHLVALNPNAKLPDGLSPRFASAFLEAKGQLADEGGIRLRLLRTEKVGNVRVIRVEIQDPLGDGDKVAYRVENGELVSPIKAASKMELEVPADHRIEVVLLDAARGELAFLVLEAPKPVVAAPIDTGPTAKELAEAEAAQMWTWVTVGATTGIVLAGAAAAGWYLSAPALFAPKSEVVFGDAP